MNSINKRLLDKKAEKRTLLQQIEMKNHTLRRLQNDRVDIIAEKHKLDEKLKNIEQKKGSYLEEMKDQLSKFNQFAFGKIRASMRQATALKQLSRVEEELRDKESGIQSLEAELRQAETDASSAKELAKRQLDEAKKASSLSGNQELPPEIQQTFSHLPDTLDELDQKIHSVQTRINCITNIDSEVVRDFENRKQRIDEMEREITNLETKTTRHRVETQVVHQRWLDPLKEVIEKISIKFSSYFAAMSCAGEVALTVPANPEEYNDYGISIRVKFRDSEQLCELTPYHQSGGERSVSTVLYMVSLQDLTKCPFRCVDEINQGMDPINERAVFDLVVRTACTGSTSQYFLFTPKLLADLSYSERLAVLPVFNGGHSSFERAWSLGSFARVRRTLEL